jgi:site-specific recombinase XerD
MEYLHGYVQRVVAVENGAVTPDTPLFWSSWSPTARQSASADDRAKYLASLQGLRQPHDLRHGVAMEVYTHHRDLEKVRALLRHVRIQTTRPVKAIAS